MARRDLVLAQIILRVCALSILLGLAILFGDNVSVLVASASSDHSPTPSSSYSLSPITAPPTLSPATSPSSNGSTPVTLLSTPTAPRQITSSDPTKTTSTPRSRSVAPPATRSSTPTPVRRSPQVPIRRAKAPRELPSYVDAVNGSDITGDGSSSFPWKTITHALSEMAGTGLNLYVAAGTYDQALGESFPIRMKSGISVLGVGYTTTILSGIGSTGVVLFEGTAFTTTTILSGFEIKGGAEGILVNGVTVGGMAPTIQANRIISNSSYGIHNAAVFGQQINARITGNLIVNNGSDGVFISSIRGVSLASPVLDGNTITNNGSSGIECFSTGSGYPYNNDYGVCSPTITHNRITNNGSDGFMCHTAYTGSCSPILNSNIIANNGGWGIGRIHEWTYLAPSSPQFYNNFIYGNASGGARFSNLTDVYGDADTPKFVNNTIAYNGLYGIVDGYTTIVNNIVWGQTVDLNAPIDKVSYSDISQGIYAGTNHNISVNPLFVNHGGGDYHIRFNSPVVNAGNCALPDLPATDIDGDPRIIGACVDMGADEVNPYWGSKQTVDHAIAQPGWSLLYTINISNTGDSTAADVIITDTLDSNVAFVSASDGGIFSNGVVIWSGFSIPVSSAVTRTLNVIIATPLPDATTIVNHVLVTDNRPISYELATITSTVYNPAVASFSAAPTTGAVPLVVTFYNQSLHSTQLLWSYGDGLTSTVSTTHTHTYTYSGTLTVTLTASNPASSDTLIRPAYITATLPVTYRIFFPVISR